MRLFFISSLIIFFISLQINLFGQTNVSKAMTLKDKYPDEEAVMQEFRTEINFQLSNDGPIASENYYERIISLRTNTYLRRSINYDDNSEISSYAVKSESGTKKYSDKKCGSVELDGIFHSDAKMCLFKMSFKNFGEILRFEAEKEYSDVKYFTKLFFHTDLPCQKRTVTLSIPNWLNLDIKEFNFEGYNIEKTETQKKSEKVITYSVSDLDSYKEENYAPGHSHTYPHLLFVFKSYTAKKEKNILLNTTADLYKWYKSLVAELNTENAVLEPVVNKLIAEANNDEEKIKNIFYWVQDNIRYIAFEDGIAGFKPEEAHKVFEKKYGDCKGMANLTKAMLKIAGFDARLTWIGTQHIAYDYSIPSLAVDNHMICTVIKDGKHYYLDATEKYIPLNDYAERIQSRPVLIEDGDNFILENVPELPHSRNLEKTKTEYELKDNLLVGSTKILLHGESRTRALKYMNKSKEKKQEDLIDYYITGGDSDTEASDIEYSDLNERESAFSINYNFSMKNKATEFGEAVYLEFDFDKDFLNMKIDEERVSDIDLGEKTHIKSETKFTIPDGYTVKHLPENFEESYDNFSAKVSFTQKDNEIIYNKEINIEKRKITKKEFDNWNVVLNKLMKTYKDQIVITQ